MKKNTVSALAALFAALALFSCGGGDDNNNNNNNNKLPFGGELMLDFDALGYYLPTYYKTDKTEQLFFRNSAGLHIYDFKTKSVSNVASSEGVQALTRGQLSLKDTFAVWQHSSNQLGFYNDFMGNKKTKLFPMGATMMPGVCLMGESYIISMGSNQLMYACGTLNDTCASNIPNARPYPSSAGKEVVSFACRDNALSIGAKDASGAYYLLYATYEVKGDVSLVVDENSRIEIPTTGKVVQSVLTDKYIVYVNDANDIYMIQMTDLLANKTAARSYLVVNRPEPNSADPNNVVYQINDLFIWGDVVVWSDNGEGTWLPWYADLSTLDPSTSRFVYSSLSNSSAPNKTPATDGKYVYWSKFADDDAATKPTLWRGEIGSEQ